MHPGHHPRIRDRTGIIALWTLTAVLAAFFIFSGAGKLSEPTTWRAEFVRWGYPGGFALVVGTLDVVAGAALLVRRLPPYAAATLGATMAGAAFTHLPTPRETMFAVVPLALLAPVLHVGWIRRPGWLRDPRGMPVGAGRKEA